MDELMNILDDDSVCIHLPYEYNRGLEDSNERILLISHELSFTGAPLALLELARCLVNDNKAVFLYSCIDGELFNLFLELGVVVILPSDKSINEQWLREIAVLFLHVVVNTSTCSGFVKVLAPLARHVHWWIHESIIDMDYRDCIDVPDLPSVDIWAASPKTQVIIRQQIQRDSKILPVCIVDKYTQKLYENVHSDITVFLWAGSICSNKSLETLLQAITLIPIELLQNMRFIICGSISNEDYTELISNFCNVYQNVIYLGELQHDELLEVMDQVDGVIVTSIEETTSMVAVEGMMKEKVVLCSEGCGITQYLTNGEDSYIFAVNDFESLSKIIVEVCATKKDLSDLRQRGRNIYLNNFSENHFQKKVKALLNEYCIIENGMNNCTGCGACATVCPKNAITLVKNKKGFFYPVILNEKCIRCGKCKNVCPENFACNPQIHDEEIFAVKAKDIVEVRKSQSGGASAVFASKIINDGGVVYGVIIDAQNVVRYMRVDNEEDLERIRGSKYVQAYLGDTFSEVKNDLTEGKLVLFIGTSCYVSGLINSLHGVDDTKLITCDLVCHGVCSPTIFKEYINSICSDNNIIEKFNFRDKAIAGWHNPMESWMLDNKKCISNTYANLFYSDLMLRESCYSCKYASFIKPADISLGDFWGIEKSIPDMHDDEGTSLVICRSEKGRKLLTSVSEKLILVQSDRVSCIQRNLEKPTARPRKVDAFWQMYFDGKTIDYLHREYAMSYYGNVVDNLYSNINNYSALAIAVINYAEVHNLNISGLCGNLNLALEINRQLVLGSKERIPFIDIYGIIERKRIRWMDVVRVEETCNREIRFPKVLLLLNEKHIVSQSKLFLEKGVDINSLIPVSFCIGEEV